MKYLKVFEGFESLKLSKVFKYIKKESRSKFSVDLRNICKDYPLSELSDDKFQYMKFTDAYKLMDKDNRKYLKFWFSLDGSYIGITKFIPTPYNISDYDISSTPIHAGRVRHLQNIYITVHNKPIMATGWVDKYGSYAISNDPVANGSIPNGTDWNKLGKYSWKLGDGDHGPIYTLELKKSKISISEGDIPPEKYNIPIDSNLKNIIVPIKEYLKNADFALILDLNDLHQSVPKKNVSLVKSERAARKKGSKKTNEEVREENIERYLSNLSNYRQDKGIDQVRNMISRLYGGNHCLYFVYFSSLDNTLSDIITFIYRLIKDKDQKCLSHISEKLKIGYRWSYLIKKKVMNNIENCRKKANENNKIGFLNYIDRYDKLNEVISRYISKKEIDTISDLEAVEQKIKMVRSILRSPRHTIRISNFLESLAGYDDFENAYGYLREEQYILEDMDNVIKTISNL